MKSSDLPYEELFAALGERTRLHLCCCLLCVPEGLAVSDLTDALAESQPNISRHLKWLRAAGLVEPHRQGRWVYYRLRDVHHPFFRALRNGLQCICGCADVQQNLRRLRLRLKQRSRRRGADEVVSRRGSASSRAGKGGRR
ncbi:MAG: metalloregulator ArsR/SmtB family transcription factor [Acidobacteriia bacterium]|mgnify:CR=1 FL=1|jgi:ArsR family transcriptional regulator|nr:metalloregulator ArsR/SmtB family transcription factor [Terriglobia bacterium]